MIVADTCLIVHLFNETGLTATAQKILDKDPIWIMPSIWQEEYANVLSKLARKSGEADQDVLSRFVQTIEALEDAEVSISIEKALLIALERKISVYDAHFVFLAEENGISLVTEDQEILKKCPHVAVRMKNFLLSHAHKEKKLVRKSPVC